MTDRDKILNYIRKREKITLLKLRYHHNKQLFIYIPDKDFFLTGIEQDNIRTTLLNLCNDGLIDIHTVPSKKGKTYYYRTL